MAHFDLSWGPIEPWLINRDPDKGWHEIIPIYNWIVIHPPTPSKFDMNTQK